MWFPHSTTRSQKVRHRGSCLPANTAHLSNARIPAYLGTGVGHHFFRMGPSLAPVLSVSTADFPENRPESKRRRAGDLHCTTGRGGTNEDDDGRSVLELRFKGAPSRCAARSAGRKMQVATPTCNSLPPSDPCPEASIQSLAASPDVGRAS